MKKEIKESISSNRRMQDSFLNFCRKGEIKVVLEMNNSSISEGYIIGFDQDSIVLDIHGSQHLYFLNSISCIKPKEEVNYIFNEAYRSKKSLKSYSKDTTYYS
ncbi:MAG: hypothetical protein GX326_00955 [Clostridiaceae bacterium]|nr:hypothetical protein [Clostridiaceae bacterium]